MTEQAYRTVLKLLPTLSAKELAGVVTAIKALGGPSAITLDDNAEDTLVLKCLCQHLADRGIEFAKPAVLTRMAVYSSFKRKCPDILEYLTRCGIKDKRQQWAVLSMGFGYLYDRLVERGWEVSASDLMTHVHRLPAVLNREFPGYAEAGYLQKIVGGQ